MNKMTEVLKFRPYSTNGKQIEILLLMNFNICLIFINEIAFNLQKIILLCTFTA